MRFEQIITAVSARVAIADVCTKLVHESFAGVSRLHRWLRMSMSTSGYLLQGSTGFARTALAGLPDASDSRRLFDTPAMYMARTGPAGFVPSGTEPTGFTVYDASKRSCHGADGHRCNHLNQVGRGWDGKRG